MGNFELEKLEVFKEFLAIEGIFFSNFSCMFLNPNNFFQFEFELF